MKTMRIKLVGNSFDYGLKLVKKCSLSQFDAATKTWVIPAPSEWDDLTTTERGALRDLLQDGHASEVHPEVREVVAQVSPKASMTIEPARADERLRGDDADAVRYVQGRRVEGYW
jgi:hypothetical protein